MLKQTADWRRSMMVGGLLLIALPRVPAQDYVPPEERVVAATSTNNISAATSSTAPDSDGEDSASIAEIFDNYVAAIGGEESLRRLESRVVRGTVESRGRTVEFESHQLADGRFALVQYFPGEVFRLAHDGIRTWTQTGDATWRSLPELDSQVERIDNHLLSPLRWREDFPVRRLLPMELVNDRRAEVIEVTYPNGKTRKLFFDTKTHLLVRTESRTIDSDGRPRTLQVTVKEFKEFDGLALPVTTETTVGGRTLVSTVKSVVHDGPVDLNLINPPVGTAAGSGFRDSERYFERLTVGELTFDNVWVHRQTNNNVLIRHAAGIHTIKLTSLPKTDLEALRPQLGDLAAIEHESKFAELNERVQEIDFGTDARAILQERIEQITSLVRLLQVPLLVAALLGHIVLSVFIVALCRGTETRAGFGAWVPLLNLSVLMRAARMNGCWPLLGIMGYLVVIALFGNQWVQPNSIPGLAVGLFGALTGIVAGVMWLVWCFKICIARNHSGWLGLLLLIPGVNLVTITYLAFSE